MHDVAYNRQEERSYVTKCMMLLIVRHPDKTAAVVTNYLVFGARPCYIMENMDAYKELKAHTSTY